MASLARIAQRLPLGVRGTATHASTRALNVRSNPLVSSGPVVSTAEDALEKTLKSGSNVFIMTAAGTPSILVNAMAKVIENRPSLDKMTAFHLHTEGPMAHVSAKLAPRIRDRSFFTGANVRKAVNDGIADYVPIFLSEIPLLFRRGKYKVDVALVTVSPADQHGFHSLGTSVDVTRAALEVADVIVAVVNPNMPRTFGDASLHHSHIDFVVEDDSPLHEIPSKAKSTDRCAAEETIGRIIAENLVKDGATLQLGIGGIPDAVLQYCKNHRDLGVHTEMFSDGIVDLCESGIVNNAKKTLDAGKVVSCFAYGSKKLYSWMDHNPSIAMMDASYTNDTAVVRRQPQMTAINSTIEVDLTGQCASDSIGTKIFSGPGGQMDMLRGASLCPDGVPIIALPSRTNQGASRILPVIKPGGGIVTTRSHVHWVVTEWGFADLFGKSLRERAQALIGLAHPDDRASLEKAAFERGLFGPVGTGATINFKAPANEQVSAAAASAVPRKENLA